MSTASTEKLIRLWCRELETRLRAGEHCLAEDWLKRAPQLDTEQMLELVYAEFACREELGQSPDPADYLARFPHLRGELEEQFLVHRALQGEEYLQPRVGQVIGHFELKRELGRGARGAVYLARDRRTGQNVALKLLLSGEYSTASELDLFRHEAAVLKRLSHPNLIGIWEAGVADGRPFLALEFAEGGTLAVRAAEFRTPRAAAAIIETIARAIHHAHSQGVVHRDLKPSNILLTADDVPKVSDFGLARILDAASGRTRTGDMVGTLSYMAPEQAAGASHRAGPSADVHALGAILFYLLTGRPPYGSEATAHALFKLLYDPPPSPHRLNPQVPRELETICLTCLEKHPQQRYASAQALAEDLRRFLDEKPIAARSIGVVAQLTRWARRRPTLAALLTVVLVAITGLVGGSLYFNARLSALLVQSNQLQSQTARANSDLHTALQVSQELRAETREQKELVERQLNDTRRALYALQLSQLPALAPRDPVRASALLADGRLCPTDLHDFTWRYFQRVIGLEERTIAAHTGPARTLTFLPDGRLLSGGEDGKLCYWKPQPYATSPGRQTVTAHTKPITGVTLVGNHVVSAGLDGLVKVWVPGATSPTRSMSSPAAIHSVAGNRTSTRIACPCDDGRVRVWELSTGELVAELTGHAGPVYAATFSSDGQTLYSAGDDRTIRVWDLATKTCVAQWTGHAATILSLTVSNDGESLLSAGDNGDVRLWDTRSGIARELRGHLMPVHATAAAPSRDLLATAGDDTYLKIWNPRSGQEITNIMKTHALAIAFSSDGEQMGFAGRDGRVGIYRLPRVPPSPRYRQEGNVATIVPRPHGGIVTSCDDGRVRIWDATSPTPIATFAVPPVDAGPARKLAVVAKGAPVLAVSRDGTMLAVGAGQGVVVLWDLCEQYEIGRLQGHEGNVVAVKFCPDGKTLATGGLDATIRLWDLTTRETRQVLKGHQAGVLAIDCSPEGKWLASGGEDNSVRLWELPSGKHRHTYDGHSMWVLSLAFSPDGRTIASGSRDRSVCLWDVHQPGPPQKMVGFTNWVFGVTYSPDNKTLVAASGHYGIDSPGEVRIYDPQAGYVRAVLNDVRAPAVFAPYGSRLYVGMPGGVAELNGD